MAPEEEMFEVLVAAATEAGFSDDEIANLIFSTTDEAGHTIAQALRDAAPNMLREHAKIRAGFEARLATRWRPALALFEMVYVACLEAGEDYHRNNPWPTGPDEVVKAQAMTLLHARACMVTSEVHALLRTGHAAGAQARWRTLHELAVVAFVLGANDGSLARRFLLHRSVERRADALCYQQNCQALGQDPLTDADMAAIEAEYQQVISQYEDGYREPWGWAKPLFAPVQRPNFDDLERLAGLDHNKPYVRLSHHSVHGGATGAIHIEEFYGRGEVMLVGPSNAGLAEPGHGSLIALHQVTVAFMLYGHGPVEDPEILMALMAISELVEEAGDAFGECDRLLEDEEAEARTMRQTPPQSRRLGDRLRGALGFRGRRRR